MNNLSPIIIKFGQNDGPWVRKIAKILAELKKIVNFLLILYFSASVNFF